MKSSRTRPLVAATFLLAAGLTSASAQVLTPTLPEPPVIEPIGPVTVVPGQALHWIFPNLDDQIHTKYVYFEGHANPSPVPPGAPRTIWIQFDWYRTTGAPELSPLIPINVDPSGGADPTGSPLFASFWIPFCPPWVSLHIQSSEPMVISGNFVHQCVPEPSQYALVAGVGAFVFGLARRRLVA